MSLKEQLAALKAENLSKFPEDVKISSADYTVRADPADGVKAIESFVESEVLC